MADHRLFAKEHPILASVLSVGENLMSDFGSLDILRQKVQNKVTGYDIPVDYKNAPMIYGGGAEVIRGQVGSDIAKATPDWTFLGHNVPQAVYNKVMSDADTAASIVLMEGLGAFKGVPHAARLLARLKAGDKTAIAEARRFLQVGEKAEKKFALEEAHTQTANTHFSDAALFGHRVPVDEGAKKIYIGEAGETFDADNVLALSTRFVNKMDPMWKNSENIKPIEGYQDIVCHGDTSGFSYKDLNGNEINMTPREFAEVLKNSPVYEGRPIRLISCEAGADDSITAQYLANQLGVDVLSPSHTVFVYPNGEMFVGPSIFERTGTWIIFKPQGK